MDITENELKTNTRQDKLELLDSLVGLIPDNGMTEEEARAERLRLVSGEIN